MTTTSKVLIGIVLVAAVALLAVFALRPHTASKSGTETEASLPTPASDTSDDALVEDTAAIDAQLNALDDDTATADQGLTEASQ